jgi:hypothetical protein
MGAASVVGRRYHRGMKLRAFASSLVVAVMILSLAAACGSGPEDASVPPPGAPASASVGPSGGSVQASGVTLTVPEGALAEPTTITVVEADTTAPTNYDTFSPIFQFSPDGLVFQKPVTVEITITASLGTPMNIVWSNLSGGYEDLTSTTNGSVMSASVTHFSHGFIGHKKDASSDGPDAAGGGDDGSPTESGPSDALTCHGNGGSCDAGTQCCSGSCNGGTCGAPDAGLCMNLHQNCTVDLPCCAGYVCLNAVCAAGG